jgi:hypothetical protein
MAKAKESNTTTRRTLLAAVPAVAVMALTSQAADADPIFAAIDAHLAAMAELDRWLALLDAGLIDGRTVNAAAMCDAGRVVIKTAPTTRAGLTALSDHLRRYFGYGSVFALSISQPCGSTMQGGGRGAAEYLIAKRTAELEAA